MIKLDTRRAGRLAFGGLAMAAVASALIGATAVPANAEAGVPAAPKTIYLEDFENVSGNGPVSLQSYTGSAAAKNSTYTANSYWLDATRCNGFILNSQATLPSGYCQNTSGTAQGEFDAVKDKTWALGLLNSPANRTTNHALSTNTSPATKGEGSPANQIQFATGSNVNLPSATGRFITFSVDAAATYCQGDQPLLRFYYRDAAGTEIPVSSSPINPCTSPNASKTTGPSGRQVSYGSFPANGSYLENSASVGIVLRNESNGAVNGNDSAIDNIRVLDVTPTLDKKFSPALVKVGDTSTLTLTVTNTSELAAKSGWGFTDQLQKGLTIADPSHIGGTCNATTTASAGGSTIAVKDGKLAAGQSSCTITVDVTSDKAGTYTNGPDNVTLTGLNPPGTTDVTFENEAPVPAANGYLLAGSGAIALVIGLGIYARRRRVQQTR
jgi:uncharacterized repeat protein (TIGR01451 family)